MSFRKNLCGQATDFPNFFVGAFLGIESEVETKTWLCGGSADGAGPVELKLMELVLN